MERTLSIGISMTTLSDLLSLFLIIWNQSWVYPHAKIHPSNKIPSTWPQLCRSLADMEHVSEFGRCGKATKASSQVSQSGFDQKSRAAGIIVWISLCSCGIRLNSQWRVVASVTDPRVCSWCTGSGEGRWMWTRGGKGEAEPMRVSWHPHVWTRSHVGLLLPSSNVHDGADLQEQLPDLHHRTEHAPGRESEQVKEALQRGWEGPFVDSWPWGGQP